MLWVTCYQGITIIDSVYRIVKIWWSCQKEGSWLSGWHVQDIFHCHLHVILMTRLLKIYWQAVYFAHSCPMFHVNRSLEQVVDRWFISSKPSWIGCRPAYLPQFPATIYLLYRKISSNISFMTMAKEPVFNSCYSFDQKRYNTIKRTLSTNANSHWHLLPLPFNVIICHCHSSSPPSIITGHHHLPSLSPIANHHCHPSSPPAITTCHHHLPLPSAINICHCHWTFPLDITICHHHPSSPSTIAIWHCHQPLPFVVTSWHCHLPLSSAIIIL